MKVGVAKETAPGERRVALVPEALAKLQAAGCEILVESGAGAGSAILDSAYAEAGATVVPTEALYQQSDVVLKVAKPSATEVGKLRQGQAVVGFLQPLIDPQLAGELAAKGVTSKLGRRLYRGALFHMLQNRLYRGEVTHKGNVYPGEQAAIVDQALWDPVQTQLAENRADRANGSHADHPSLLVGLAYERWPNTPDPDPCQ